jgi:hypothetical protein
MTTNTYRSIRYLGRLAALATLAASCSSPSPSSKCEDVTCPAASDRCHVAGTCDSATGACSAQTAKTCPTGQACDAADGECKPENRCANVTCTATDPCHVAGICDPKTGACSEQTAKTCPSGESCDVADGTCKPAGGCANVKCPEAVDLCHVAGTCSNQTGTCSAPTAKTCPEGQSCDLADGKCKGGCANVTCPSGEACNPNTGKCQSGSLLVATPKAAKNLGISRVDGVAVDSTGAVYVTGPLSDAQSFDTFNLTPAGASDVFLAKYDSVTHNAVWAKAYGDTDEQWTIGLALTQDGTLVSLGNFLGKLNTATNATDHPTDFLMGVDAATGNVKWTNMFDNGSGGAILSIATNPNQNIIAVCGYSSQTSNMVTPAPAYGGGLRDAIVAVYRSTGEKVWAREIGGAAAEQCSGLAVDAAGDVYAVGRYNGALDLGGPTPLPALAGSLAVNWTWVAKFRGTDGTTLADSYIGGRNAADTANAGNHTPAQAGLAVDSAGNVVIVGQFTVSMVYPTKPTATKLVSAGGADAFVAKLDPTFAPLWAVRMGSPGADDASAVALTFANDPVVVGSHNATTTGDAEISVPNNSAWPNAFVLKLDGATGAKQFAASYGDEAESQWATRLAIHGTSFAFGGNYKGTIDFGGGLSVTGPSGAEKPPGSYLVFGDLQ